MAWASPGRAAPVVSVALLHGAYVVEGFFEVDASSKVAWEVLSDYDHIGDFVSSMHESSVRERRADGVLLEQEALGKAFFVSRKVEVLLEVREEPFRSIVFQDISLKDFEAYQGLWTITQLTGNLIIRYNLNAKPRFPAPRVIARRAFKTNAARLLKEVRAEIVRRSRK